MQVTGRQFERGTVEVMLTATDFDHVIEQVRSGDADVGFVEGTQHAERCAAASSAMTW